MWVKVKLVAPLVPGAARFVSAMLFFARNPVSLRMFFSFATTLFDYALDLVLMGVVVLCAWLTDIGIALLAAAVVVMVFLPIPSSPALAFC